MLRGPPFPAIVNSITIALFLFLYLFLVVERKKEGTNERTDEPHGSCFRVASSGAPAMDTLIPEICRLLNDTLSPEKAVLASATDGLDRLSRFPHFPLSLLAVATGWFVNRCSPFFVSFFCSSSSSCLDVLSVLCCLGFDNQMMCDL